jgi:hypothetical protein
MLKVRKAGGKHRQLRLLSPEVFSKSSRPLQVRHGIAESFSGRDVWCGSKPVRLKLSKYFPVCPTKRTLSGRLVMSH